MTPEQVNTSDKIYNVIIVEDSESYRFLLTKFLKDRSKFDAHLKYNIHSFSSAEECLENMHAISPDLVVLDYNLDDTTPTNYSEEHGIENGFDLMLEIKKSFPKIKVLFLSDQDNVHVTAHVFHNGADGYIPKNPFGRSRIYSFITKLLTELSLEKELPVHEKTKAFRTHAFSLTPID